MVEVEVEVEVELIVLLVWWEKCPVRGRMA